MSETHYLPQWLEYRAAHVSPARAEFDASVEAAVGVDEAARKYLRALWEHRRRIDDSPGGAGAGGDGSAMMGAFMNGAAELYAEIDSEVHRVMAIAGHSINLEG